MIAEGTLAVCLGYMLCVSIVVLMQKDGEAESTDDFETATLGLGDARKARLKLAAKRLALYPLICFVTTSGHVPFSFSLEISEATVPVLKHWFLFGIGLPGLLNSLVLLLDPAVTRTLMKCVGNVAELPTNIQSIPSYATQFRLSQEHPIAPPRLPPAAAPMHQGRRSCDTLVAQ